MICSIKCCHNLAALLVISTCIAAMSNIFITVEATTIRSRLRGYDVTRRFQSASRFNVKSQEFSPSVMDGYSDCEDLKLHIVFALKELADKKITDQKSTSCTYWDDDYSYSGNDDGFSPVSAPPPPSFSVGADNSLSGGFGRENGGTGGVNSFETNNQVDGVDEADLVKANDQFVFMTYDNEIIVTNTDGQLLVRTKIPQPPQPLENDNDDGYYYHVGTRTIKGLLLEEGNILTVMAEHYDGTDQDSPLGNTITTTFVYQFDEEDSNLLLKEQFETTGSYFTARLINGTSYVTTTAHVDTYNFTGALYRCSDEFRGLSDEQYEDKAFGIASATVDAYADKIMNALDFTNQSVDACENIVQIFDQNPNQVAELPDMWFIYQLDNVLDTFVQITSFDSSKSLAAGDTIERNYAGSFLPTWDTQIYSSSNVLVLSGGGYRLVNVTDEKNRDGQLSFEYTFLMTFSLDDGKAVPNAAGEVQGSIMSGNMGQFSMDFFDDHLRVATSSGARYGFFPLENGHNVWKEMDPAKPLVSVFEEQDGTLVRVGRTEDLGIDGTISSVRFLGERGYVSSWQDGDPLYVLDLSEPSNPLKAGKLNVTDRLSYMHPVDNGTKLLAVGTATTDESHSGGIKISLFDVSDASNPSEEQTYVFETIGSSDAMYDHHAFRYIEEIGMLIIPGYENSWKDKIFFDGAWLFQIDATNGISQEDSVLHAGLEEMTNWFCWNTAQLPSRSMMFNGGLLTMQSHSIVMTKDSVSKKINLDEGRDEKKTGDCSRYGNEYFW